MVCEITKAYDVLPDNTKEFHDETLPKESAKVAYFCSMKITQEVCEFAAAQGIDEAAALAKRMEVKADDFFMAGAEVYRRL